MKVVSSVTMTANVLQLAEGGDFEAPTFQASTNVHSEPKSFCHHERPAYGKVLLVVVFYFLSNII